MSTVHRRQVMAAAGGLLGAAAGVPLAATPAQAAPSDPPLGPALLAGRLRLVSLSHVNDPAQTFIFPGDPPFILSTAATIAQDGYYLQYVQEGEHTGTHWGAPGHFNPDAVLADQMDPNDLLLPAVRIDIRAKAADNPDYALTVEDLLDWERRHGPIPQESAIVLWTGFGAKWGTPAYPNLDADGTIHQPGFGVPAVRWLIDHGKLGYRGALGSDTLGPDVGIDDQFQSSTLLYDHRRISLENMANLELLPTRGAWVLPGGPINRRGSGSPAHIFGLIPQ